MSLQPLLETSWVIQIHAYAAFSAFILGAVQLAAPKGTLPHRALGVVWVLLMTAITISSMFVRPSLDPGLPLVKWFSWIHLFTVLATVNIVMGVFLLVRGGPARKRHARPFIGIFIGGLVIAGALAFLPGRIMHQVVLGT